MEIKVYEAVAKTLGRLGVERAFGLVGSGNFGLVDHMTSNCGVAFYASRHEEAAVAMADGYARVSGKLGICTVHQGPGVTNTLTALTEAVKNSTPLLRGDGCRPLSGHQRDAAGHDGELDCSRDAGCGHHPGQLRAAPFRQGAEGRGGSGRPNRDKP